MMCRGFPDEFPCRTCESSRQGGSRKRHTLVICNGARSRSDAICFIETHPITKGGIAAVFD